MGLHTCLFSKYSIVSSIITGTTMKTIGEDTTDYTLCFTLNLHTTGHLYEKTCYTKMYKAFYISSRKNVAEL